MSQELEFVTARLVLQLSNLIVSERNQHLEALEMTTAQADALIFFAEHPHSTITSLKQAQQVSHATAQMLSQRLIKKGYVTLTVDEADRRAKVITLTPAGKSMRQKLKANGSHTGEKLLDHYSATDSQQLIHFLRQSIANLTDREV